MKSKLIHRKLHCSLVALKQSETGDSRNHLFVVRAFSFCCANLHRKSEFLKARVCQNPLVRCLVRLARQWFSLRCKHSYLNWKLHLSSFTSTFHFSSSLSLSELGTLQKLCHWPTEWSVWTRRRPFVWPVWPILCRKTKKRSTQSAAKAVSCKVSFNGTYEDILWPPPIQTFCIYYYIYILFFIVVIDIYIYWYCGQKPVYVCSKLLLVTPVIADIGLFGVKEFKGSAAASEEVRFRCISLLYVNYLHCLKCWKGKLAIIS